MFCRKTNPETHNINCIFHSFEDINSWNCEGCKAILSTEFSVEINVGILT